MKRVAGVGARKRNGDGLTCRELIEFLDDYVAHQLAPARVAAFERHLADCPSCVAYVATYRATIRLGHGAFREAGTAPPPELAREIARAILASRER